MKFKVGDTVIVKGTDTFGKVTSCYSDKDGTVGYYSVDLGYQDLAFITENSLESFYKAPAIKPNDSKPLKDKDLQKYLSKVIINDNKKVVVIETPNGKFKTTCDKDDYYDPFVGFCIAFTSSFFGKTRLKKWFERKLTKLPNQKGNKIIEL